MGEMVTNAEFLSKIRRARAEWDQAVAKVPRLEMASPSSDGEASLKDVMAHITWYEREMVLSRRSNPLVREIASPKNGSKGQFIK